MYIKNQGNAKTVTYKNKKKDVKQVNWNAEYDGNVANLAVNLLVNNKFRHYEATLDNKDLEEMLSIPTVHLPLEKRLQDFKEKNNPYIIEIPNRPLTINNNSKFVFKQKITKSKKSKKHKSKKHRNNV